MSAAPTMTSEGEWAYLGGVFHISKGVVRLIHPTTYPCLTILAIHRCCYEAHIEGTFYGSEDWHTAYESSPSMRWNDILVDFEPGVLATATQDTLVSLGFVNQNDQWAWKDIRTPVQLAKHLHGTT